MSTAITTILITSWEQSGSGMGYYSGRRVVFFKAVKPALMGFAKWAEKSVFAAGAAALKSVIDGTNSGESANNAFSDVGMSLLDDTVSRTNGKKMESTRYSGREVEKAETFLQHLQLKCKTLFTPMCTTHSTSTARHGRF